ncbi:MAG: 5-formyltetrahydrofolate cyclo-ligase [Verrucomicrobiales bacterium]|jgi:5-formyltetrahydrofolate cyclo-ligase|nr:5-formyltetrahydrofolate cyclo-ligase [Verrucomicrobiales bacterium]
MTREILDKTALRAQMKQTLAALTVEEKKYLSRKLVEKIEAWQEWRYAKNILLFMPLPSEPDIRQLMGYLADNQKSISLPRFDPNTQQYCAAKISHITSDLRYGQFKILEPSPECACVPINQLDMILVPGLGFDLQGRRLGRGKGFYDRLLSAATGLRCGVGFDEQILPNIPVEAHDVKLDWVLTPARLFGT